MLRLMHSISKFRTTAAKNAGNDIYVVEFPKSGITWLSTILTNVAFLAAGMDRRATYFNVSAYVPDIHITGRSVGDSVKPYLGLRFIKSHDTLNLNYRSVIYLCRDPFAVLSSYYRFKRQAAKLDLSIDDLLRKGGVLDQWKGHVNGWLSFADQRRRLTLVRYEDILADAEKEIGELIKVLGIDIDAELLRKAVERSAIGPMQEDENRYRVRNPRYVLEFVKSERDTPLDAYKAEIYERTKAERQLLGYQD